MTLLLAIGCKRLYLYLYDKSQLKVENCCTPDELVYFKYIIYKAIVHVLGENEVKNALKCKQHFYIAGVNISVEKEKYRKLHILVQQTNSYLIPWMFLMA